MVKGLLIIHPYGWRGKMNCHPAIITVRKNALKEGGDN
jgi:hypothetical protein